MAIDTNLYFAWVNATDSTFLDSYARNDETILGFVFEQLEGEFATLQITVKPQGEGISLLGASRKQWAWFSYSQGTDIIPKFFGRLDAVGTVNSDDGPAVVLSLVAEPQDYLNQKKTVADGLRVLRP